MEEEPERGRSQSERALTCFSSRTPTARAYLRLYIQTVASEIRFVPLQTWQPGNAPFPAFTRGIQSGHSHKGRNTAKATITSNRSPPTRRLVPRQDGRKSDIYGVYST